MGAKRKPAADNINIDCFRGLGAHSLSPSEVKDNFDEFFENVDKDALHVIAKISISKDFNRSVDENHQIGPLNVCAVKRCSAAVKIASRAVNYGLKKKEPEGEFKVLVIKPAYALLKEAFTDLGWGVVETDNYQLKKTDFQRLQLLRKALKQDKEGKIRVLALNSPNNPLCEIYSRNFIEGILQILDENPRLRLFSDVVYEKLVASKTPVPTAFSMASEKQRERIYEFSGNSKTVMPGDKRTAGWMLSSADNIKKVETLLDKGKINNGRTHKLTKKRVGALLVSHSMTPEHFEKLFAHYAAAKEELAKVIKPELPTGVKLVYNNNLHFMMFDFSGLNNLGIKIDVDDIVKKMADEHHIRLLPPSRIGCDNALRISLGSVFVRKGVEYPFAYKPDGRDKDFAPLYEGWRITSDLCVHKHIAKTLCEVVKQLIRERDQSASCQTQKRSGFLSL